MHERTVARTRGLLLLISLGGAVAPNVTRADGPPQPSHVAPASAPAPTEAHAYAAMNADARRLATSLGMPGDQREAALARLHTALARGKIAAFAANTVINGVFAYQMGEGGFLVKVKKGKGLAHLVGQPRDIALQLKSVTFGAQIGGGSEWGFGVILGLRNPTAFGGEYKGDNRGATAGQESINITKLVKKGFAVNEENYHELYMIGVASGLSAGAAIGNLTITPGG